jgi:hypothetical protein
VEEEEEDVVVRCRQPELAVLEDVCPLVVCVDRNDVEGTIVLTVVQPSMMALHALFIKRTKLAVNGKTVRK